MSETKTRAELEQMLEAAMADFERGMERLAAVARQLAGQSAVVVVSTPTEIKVWDRVRVTHDGSLREGQVGKVVQIIPDGVLPYMVGFADGKMLGWKRSEIELVKE